MATVNIGHKIAKQCQGFHKEWLDSYIPYLSKQDRWSCKNLFEPYLSLFSCSARSHFHVMCVVHILNSAQLILRGREWKIGRHWVHPIPPLFHILSPWLSRHSPAARLPTLSIQPKFTKIIWHEENIRYMLNLNLVIIWNKQIFILYVELDDICNWLFLEKYILWTFVCASVNKSQFHDNTWFANGTVRGKNYN